jgi:hypothetical protein
MSIAAGTPVVAPKGFKNLAAGVTYYFLRSSPKTERVTLVDFVVRPPKKVVYAKAKIPKRTVAQLPLPMLTCLPRSDWEDAIWAGKVLTGERKSMPPWLEGLEGLDLVAMDARRKDPAKSHRDRVDEKLFSIQALVNDAEKILDSDEPEKLINRHARIQMPPQNETRLRLNFFVFIAFGRNRNALHYRTHQIGHWDRLSAEHANDAKRGAPGGKGAEHGYNATAEMVDKIKGSYVRHSEVGVTDEQIYVAAMRDDFGCKTRWVTQGHERTLEHYHPLGEAFPKKGLYFYYVNKFFRPHLVQEARLGKNRARSKIKPFLGTFTEAAWNLLQRVEADAYFVEDLPRGYIEGSDLPPLVVVVCRDTASGKKVGIGFSQGSETGGAYRMAIFCMAIGLEAFALLLGLKIKDSSKGLSPHGITDRGPGATDTALSRDPDLRPVIREGTQSYSGQAKAIVETSNPKTPSDDEAPSFRRSGMTVIELACRELGKFLVFNESTNVASRIDPELEHKVPRLSPNGIWEALDSVGRNDAVLVAFEDAVRAYLDLVPAVLTRGGLMVAGRNYYSKAEAFQEALGSVAEKQETDVKVYVLSCCIRHVWFEWNHRLIQLDVRYPIAVSRLVKDMSLAEALEYHQHMAARIAAHDEHRRAARAHIEEDFQAQTSMSLNSGMRTRGRPKRGGAAARQEAKEAKEIAAGRRAA